MSNTIGNLVDRVFREYLEPNDDVQSFTIWRNVSYAILQYIPPVEAVGNENSRV